MTTSGNPTTFELDVVPASPAAHPVRASESCELSCSARPCIPINNRPTNKRTPRRRRRTRRGPPEEDRATRTSRRRLYTTRNPNTRFGVGIDKTVRAVPNFHTRPKCYEQSRPDSTRGAKARTRSKAHYPAGHLLFRQKKREGTTIQLSKAASLADASRLNRTVGDRIRGPLPFRPTPRHRRLRACAFAVLLSAH
jgi:lipoprotein-anchoring transpeptidase ErfK/SrfK